MCIFHGNKIALLTIYKQYRLIPCMTENKQANPLGYAPINKLIVKMSVPLMLSMLIQALYNVVDSIFVSHYSEVALTAVSLAYPVQALMISVAVGTAVGMLSLLSRRLGEKRFEEAKTVAHTGLFLALISYLVFAVLGIVGVQFFFKLFTDDEQLIAQSVIYIRICMIGSFGFFLGVMFERVMQATGDAFHSMLSQGAGAICNIILDPIFIFVLDMGVAGAAIATVLGQIMGLLVAVYYTKKNKELEIHIRLIKPNWKVSKEIYQVGLPGIVMQALGSVFVSVLNGLLIVFTPVAVSVFGIYFKLQSFVFMPVFGINNGITSIMAYNYGARNKKRMMTTLSHALIISLFIMALGTTLFICAPNFLLGMFNASEEMMVLGIPALRIIAISFLPAAVSIVLISSFQATGFGLAAMFISLIRQIIVLLPCAYILSKPFGLTGIWSSFIIAEIVGLTTALIFYAYNYKKRIKPLDSIKG